MRRAQRPIAEQCLTTSGRQPAAQMRAWRPCSRTSLPEEYDYAPRLEGQLPPALQGTLWRNGPGLFDRDDLHKRMLLDGDGMIQTCQFRDGRVRLRTRFVRTCSSASVQVLSS